ncbi:hypothetical protein PFISCL1PPCAC_13430, partial [Pristionchus fissidentatus]
LAVASPSSPHSLALSCLLGCEGAADERVQRVGHVGEHLPDLLTNLHGRERLVVLDRVDLVQGRSQLLYGGSRVASRLLQLLLLLRIERRHLVLDVVGRGPVADAGVPLGLGERLVILNSVVLADCLSSKILQECGAVVAATSLVSSAEAAAHAAPGLLSHIAAPHVPTTTTAVLLSIEAIAAELSSDCDNHSRNDQKLLHIS